jgi:hypothetical protein
LTQAADAARKQELPAHNFTIPPSGPSLKTRNRFIRLFVVRLTLNEETAMATSFRTRSSRTVSRKPKKKAVAKKKPVTWTQWLLRKSKRVQDLDRAVKTGKPRKVLNASRRIVGLKKDPTIAELVVRRMLAEAAVPLVAATGWVVLTKYQPVMTLSDVLGAIMVSFAFAWLFWAQLLRIIKTVRDHEHNRRTRGSFKALQKKVEETHTRVETTHALVWSIHSKLAQTPGMPPSSQPQPAQRELPTSIRRTISPGLASERL